MKKLYLILCAGILALAAVSCKKDAQPVEPAKPMSATEIKQKLANTAVDALNEVVPGQLERLGPDRHETRQFHPTGRRW